MSSCRTRHTRLNVNISQYNVHHNTIICTNSSHQRWHKINTSHNKCQHISNQADKTQSQHIKPNMTSGQHVTLGSRQSSTCHIRWDKSDASYEQKHSQNTYHSRYKVNTSNATQQGGTINFMNRVIFLILIHDVISTLQQYSALRIHRKLTKKALFFVIVVSVMLGNISLGDL